MSKAKILVVEDEALVAVSIKSTLQNRGYNVLDTVFSGEEAIQKVSEACPDLVLMDINLIGEMDGIETARQIQKHFDIPIVYLTGHSDDATQQEAMTTEPYGYIPKPFAAETLVITVEMALCRHKGDDKIRKLSHAVEYSSATVVITNIKGEIEYANPKFSQLTGFSIEEVIGRNPRIMKSGKASSEVYKELWGTILSGNEWKGEFCNKKKNGELYWEHASISPVKNNEGAITSFIAVKDDITEQKRIQEALIKSEEKYRKLVEIAQDAILCCINGTITDCNKSAEKLFGYSKNEIIGKDVNILVPDKYKKEHQEGQERFLKTGKSKIIGKTVEVSGITKEGIEIPLEMSLASQKRETEQYYFMAIIRDLTERKKMEAALLQSEKLKSLGTITAGIAHDFNNILAVISGKVQLMEMDYESNKELTDELSIIMKAIDDGVEISSRMFKFTKTEKNTTGFVPYDIRDLLMESIDFIMPRWKSMAQANGIGYQMDTDSIREIPPILCNPTEIREVFINMINNALDAMPEGGSISFSTWSGDDTVFVSISDTGEGMPKDVKKRIFDPFFPRKEWQGPDWA